MVCIDRQVQTDSEITQYVPGPRPPDTEGYHYVPCHDGVRLRCSLLLGGPDGNHRINPKRRTAICLHGLGDSMSWWADGVFRLHPLPPTYASMFGEPLTNKLQQPDSKRRAKFVRALAKQMNVVLVDQRGFGGSGRPYSSGAFADTSLVGLWTYTVSDMSAFTEAIRADIEASRRANFESHSVSVSGSTALVRVVFDGLVQLGRYAATQKTLEQQAALLRLDLTGPAADVMNLAVLGLDFSTRKELRQLAWHPGAFRVDRASWLGQDAQGQSTEVLVLHRLAVPERDTAFNAACAACGAEMRGDALSGRCLAFGIAHDRTGALALASFPGVRDALAYLQRFQAWMSAESALGRGTELSSVEAHARAPELRELRAVPEVKASVQLFQLFPLSFEHSQATEASATMEDFVEDVESVLRYMGVPRATIVGHSMGAAVALMHAVRHTSSVERLCTSGGAPRVGQQARALWLYNAGSRTAWVPNLMRTAVSLANMEDAELHQVDTPVLLINAKDDTLTPLLGSQMLRAALPQAVLEVPDFGGHDSLVQNDAPFERLVRFMLADEAMVFAEDTLFADMVTSSWNLSGDKFFMRYYQCGCALAEVEQAQRRLRLIRNWARDGELQDDLYLQGPGVVTHMQAQARAQEVSRRGEARAEKIRAEQEVMAAVVGKLGLAATSGSGAPRDAVLAEMTAMLRQMSAPARSAVEQAAVWWRDNGTASEGLTEGKYTVDAWMRRRGGSRKHGCTWYRWGMGCVPAEMRDRLTCHSISEPADSELFSCWWCGGPPAGHEDLGPAGGGEPPGFYPGLGSGRESWKKPAYNPAPEALALTA